MKIENPKITMLINPECTDIEITEAEKTKTKDLFDNTK